MRALIPLALAALLSACLPFGGRDEAVPRKDNPLAAGTVSVTSLDAPAAAPATAPTARAAGPAIAPATTSAPQARPAAPETRASTTAPTTGSPSAGPAPATTQEQATAAPAATADGAGASAEDAPPPPPKSPMQIACEKDGGTWSRAGGSVAMTCFKPTRDGGKSCRRESDCSTLCLARSRTCAPVTPLFGCHSVLQNDARAVTLCLD